MSPKIIVVGAGYAGVSAAQRFARAGVGATVVNPRAEFVERIRLHQLLAGNREAALPLRSLLPERAEFVQDAVSTIDTAQRRALLASGRELEFDHLVHAVGSRGRLDVIPGAQKHAVCVSVLEDARIARERFAALAAGSVVTVVGGGLTGVELAGELAELGQHAIRLVTDGSAAPGVSERGRAHVRRFLGEHGVDLLEDTRVEEVHGSEIACTGGTARSDLTIVVAASTPPALAADSDLDVDADGALRVDRTLVSSCPAVVGAGDAARVTAAPLRRSCQAAIPLGAHAADTVLHQIRGSSPKPARPKFVGQCVSLGRRDGLWQQTTPSDRPVRLIATGRPAAVIKEKVCAGTIGVSLNPRIAPIASWG
jgi:NADH dehydrogenase